jgi:hypothetical protein
LKEVGIERLCSVVTDETKRVHFANDTTHVINELKTELKNKEEFIKKLQQETKTIQNHYESATKGVRKTLMKKKRQQKKKFLYVKLIAKEDALGSLSTTITSIHNKELKANIQVFDKDMEIRKYKNEMTDLKNKLDILSEEVMKFIQF